MRHVRTMVIGLGAMGSAALYYLTRRDAEPIGLERFHAGHPYGSSHGHSRAFRSFYHDPVYVTPVRSAYPLWRDLESTSGEHLLTLNGMVLFAREGHTTFDQNLRIYKQMGANYELMTPGELTTRFPALHPPEKTTACYTPFAGFLDATRCVQTHVSQAQRFGATVRDQMAVQHIDLDQKHPVVHVSGERYRCDRVIVTAGPWAADLLRDLSIPLQVTQQQKFYFQSPDSEQFRPDRLPVYSDYDTSFYGFPWYGPGIKVADDIHGQITTGDTVDRTLNIRTRDTLKSWLHRIMPGNTFSYVTGDTCMYTLTPDQDFVIGPHPDNPHVIIAAGFSGHGFKFSTLIGRILADLALDGSTSYPVERFRIERFRGTSRNGSD